MAKSKEPAPMTAAETIEARAHEADHKPPGAMVPSEPRENPLTIPREWGLQIPIGDYRTTLNESTDAGADALFRFLNGDGLPPDSMANLTKQTTDISIMPIGKEVNGEILPLPRVAVHHADGTFTDFRSPGILKSLGFIIKRFGVPPWNPPLNLRLERFPVGQTDDGKPKYMYRYTVAS